MMLFTLAVVLQASLPPVGLVCRVTHRVGVDSAGGHTPDMALLATSAELSHTCQPLSQRSVTEQPVPFGLLLSLPETRPHAGCKEAGLTTPGTSKPPEHPAMDGSAEMSV